MRATLALAVLLLLLSPPARSQDELASDSSSVRPSSSPNKQQETTSVLTNAPESRPSDSKEAPEAGQKSPVAGPSDPKEAPEASQKSPVAGPSDPKEAPEASQKSPVAGPSDPKEAPEASQKSPVAGPSDSKEAPEASQKSPVAGPSDPKEAPEASQKSPVASQKSPVAGPSDPKGAANATQAPDISHSDPKVTPASESTSISTDHSTNPKDSDGSTQSPTTEITNILNKVKTTDEPGDTGKQSMTITSVTQGETVQTTSLSPSQVTTPGITPGSGGTTPKPTGGSPEEQPTTTPGPKPSPTFGTRETFAIPATSAAVDGGKSTTSKEPAFPGMTASTATLTIGRFPSSSPELTPTIPQGSSPPSSSSAIVECEAPVEKDEKMLILNLTKTSLCPVSPSNEKLHNVLCKTVKTSFNPARDQCFIWLAPVLDSQAVVVQNISVMTNFLPKDIYELLKDKWADLQEVGVSHMQFGDQGPPVVEVDRFSMPLIITIVCMASFLLLVAALYGCCHQRLSHRKDQQRLTEELQTVENGYHDNPTLEVMETSSEMQEKKVVNLNGELGDSWIVPLDNLTKDDLDEEEDTHL